MDALLLFYPQYHENTTPFGQFLGLTHPPFFGLPSLAQTPRAHPPASRLSVWLAPQTRSETCD
jgi:hypothetical protein